MQKVFHFGSVKSDLTSLRLGRPLICPPALESCLDTAAFIHPRSDLLRQQKFSLSMRKGRDDRALQ